MNINIFEDYNVHSKCEFTYRNEENDYFVGNNTWSKVLAGYKLIELIQSLLKDKDISELSIENDTIKVSCFNEMTGEVTDTELIIKEINNDSLCT